MWCTTQLPVAVPGFTHTHTGDHISIPGESIRVSGLNVYRHHMIVVEVVAWNKVRVIHYSKTATDDRATITEEECEINPYTDNVYRIDYDPSKSHNGHEAIDRALDRCDESGYNLLFNNCESFCTWVKVNKNSSSQAQVGVGMAAAGAAVVGTVAALSLIVYRVFRSSNNK